MKQVDDAFNLRNYDRFLNQLHSEDVKVIQFGSESTLGRPPHRNVIEEPLRPSLTCASTTTRMMFSLARASGR